MKQEHVSKNSFETVPSSRRHFLATIGKGAALASLGIFGAGSDAAVRGLFGRGLIPAAWADVEQNPDTSFAITAAYRNAPKAATYTVGN